jgi:hypothetical protein
VEIFDYDDDDNATTWERVGTPVEGDAVDESEGFLVSLSPEGHYFAVGSNEENGRLRVYEITRL